MVILTRSGRGVASGTTKEETGRAPLSSLSTSAACVVLGSSSWMKLLIFPGSANLLVLGGLPDVLIMGLI